AGCLDRQDHHPGGNQRHPDGAPPSEHKYANGLPWGAWSATDDHQRATRSNPRERGCQHARFRPEHHRYVQAPQTPGRWDLGGYGSGMGMAIAAAVETGHPVLAVEGDSAFGFSGMEIETICRYNLPVCVVVFNNGGIYRGTGVNPGGGADVATTVFVKDARYDKMMEAF